MHEAPKRRRRWEARTGGGTTEAPCCSHPVIDNFFFYYFASVDAVFSDLSKALDTAPRYAFILKLRGAGIDDDMLQCMRSYLTGPFIARTFRKLMVFVGPIRRALSQNASLAHLKF